VGAVDKIVTELAVFEFIEGQLVLRELMPGVDMDEVRAKTKAAFTEQIR
jgi:3-oxoacid CoA-transferase